MPRTPVRHPPRATRSDPLQRTRSAVHLDLPPYTPQTRFFHSNLGVPNGVPATHDEIIVLSKTVEVARRILGSIRSEVTTIDALMDVEGLALDETLGETPPVKEAPERDWIAKQVGDWLRGSNMVIYIDVHRRRYRRLRDVRWMRVDVRSIERTEGSLHIAQREAVFRSTEL